MQMGDREVLFEEILQLSFKNFFAVEAYRFKLLQEWKKKCLRKGIDTSR